MYESGLGVKGAGALGQGRVCGKVALSQGSKGSCIRRRRFAEGKRLVLAESMSFQAVTQVVVLQLQVVLRDRGVALALSVMVGWRGSQPRLPRLLPLFPLWNMGNVAVTAFLGHCLRFPAAEISPGLGRSGEDIWYL